MPGLSVKVVSGTPRRVGVMNSAQHSRGWCFPFRFLQIRCFASSLGGWAVGPTKGRIDVGAQRLHLQWAHVCFTAVARVQHVWQYEQAGSIASYLPIYLQQVADYGYEDAPLENDARDHEIKA